MHYAYSLEYHGQLHIQLHMCIKNKIRRRVMEKLFEELGSVNKKINEGSITGEINICVIAVNASPFNVNAGIAVNDNEMDRLDTFGAIDKKIVEEIIKKNIKVMIDELENHTKQCTKKSIGIDLISGFAELAEDDDLMDLFGRLTK